MYKAFTMIELVFVLVIAGILMSLALPRLNKNKLPQAANQLISHIRYTQHLAMQDNKFDPRDKKWYKGRWQILFNSDANTEDEWSYTIFSDKPTYSGKPDVFEMAKNPDNLGKVLSGGFSGTLNCNDEKATKELNIGKRYGVADIFFSKSCSFYGSMRIVFDNFGRPLKGDLRSYLGPYPNKNRLISSICTISLCTKNPCPKKDGVDKISIAIEPESGYAYILKQVK